MQVEDCFQLGYVSKAHGIKGEVRVIFDVMYLDDYLEKESIFLFKGGKLTPFSIEKFSPLSNREAILGLQGINTRDEAEELRGAGIFLPLEELPELREGEFYYHEIIGFKVIDEILGELGVVLRVEEMPSQDLLVIEYQGKEALIPITDNFVPGIDRVLRIVKTRLPDQHLEVYS